MKWSPPRIEHCRWPQGRMDLQHQLLLLSVCAGAMAGCASMPVMESPASARSTAANSAPPEFDVIPTTVAQKPAETQNSSIAKNSTPSAASEQKPSPSGSLSAPLPVSPESRNAQSTPQNPTASSTTPPTSTENKIAASEMKPVEPAKISSPPTVTPIETPKPAIESSRVALNEPAKDASSSLTAPVIQKPTTTAEPAKVAARTPSGFLVTPPKPFAWETSGKSTGQHAFQVTSPGDDGYRTLVVGSLGGNDPVAIDLVDRLARRLHDDSVILGGYDCTIIRTLNPDGEVAKRFLNQKGEYVNSMFPKAGDKAISSPVAEVDFFLKQMQKVQPQRVVHLRTVKGETGLVAASQSCETVGREVAQWMNFRFISLPGENAAEGSIERFVSASGSSDMLTIGIPNSTTSAESWDRYGDALMNLLMRDDLATRELARKQTQPSSADRRNQSP